MKRSCVVLSILLLALAGVSASPREAPQTDRVSFDYKEKPAREAWQDFASQIGYTLEFAEEVDGEQLLTARAERVEPWLGARLLAGDMDGWVMLHASEKVVEVVEYEASSKRKKHAAAEFAAGHTVAQSNLQKLYGPEKGTFDKNFYVERISIFLRWDLGRQDITVNEAACAIEGEFLQEDLDHALEFGRLLAAPMGGRSGRFETGDVAWRTLQRTIVEFESRDWTLEEFAALIQLRTGVSVVLVGVESPKPLALDDVALTGAPVCAADALERALPLFGCRCSMVGPHLLIYGEYREPPPYIDQGYAVYELLPIIEQLVGGSIGELNRARAGRWHAQLEEQLFQYRLDDCWLGTRVAIGGSVREQEPIQWLLSQYTNPSFESCVPEPKTVITLKLVDTTLADAARALAEKLGYRVWLSKDAKDAPSFDLSLANVAAPDIAKLLGDLTGVRVTLDHGDRCVVVGTTRHALQDVAPTDYRLSFDLRDVATGYRLSGLPVPEPLDPDAPWTEADRIGFAIQQAMWDAVGAGFRSEGSVVADQNLFLSGPEREIRHFADLKELLEAKGSGKSAGLLRQQALWNRLQETTLAVELKDQSVDDAIEWLRIASDENVFIDRQTRDKCGAMKLTLNLGKVPVTEALDAIGKAAGISWGMLGNVVVFAAEARDLFEAENGFAVYDLRPLLETVKGADARSLLVAELVEGLCTLGARNPDCAVACGPRIIITGDMRVQEAAVEFLKSKGWQEK